jgi:transcriptional regulator with XRE-family HTH domain
LPFSLGVPVTLKALRPKDYSKAPKTLGEHLKKQRRVLGLLQREVAERMGIDTWTYLNWEKDKTVPVATRFRPVVAFLGYDPTPEPTTLAKRLEAKRRTLGATFEQVARYLGWDPGTLTRYLNGTWRIPGDRMAVLERLLLAESTDLSAIHRVPRRLRRKNN